MCPYMNRHLLYICVPIHLTRVQWFTCTQQSLRLDPSCSLPPTPKPPPVTTKHSFSVCGPLHPSSPHCPQRSQQHKLCHQGLKIALWEQSSLHFHGPTVNAGLTSGSVRLHSQRGGGGGIRNAKSGSILSAGFLWRITVGCAYSASLIGLRGLANKRSIFRLYDFGSVILQSIWKRADMLICPLRRRRRQQPLRSSVNSRFVFAAYYSFWRNRSRFLVGVVTALPSRLTHSNIHIYSAAWDTWLP